MAAQSTLRGSADPVAALFHRYVDLLQQRVKSTSKTTKLLGTLLLAASIIAGGAGSRKLFKKRKADREQGKRLVRRNSGLKLKDGSRVIFVPHKDSTTKVTIHPTKPMTFDAHRDSFSIRREHRDLQMASILLRYHLHKRNQVSILHFCTSSSAC
jgi:ATP-binding cassette subfamily D (ALD) long-chain fatty acid import protein